MQQKRAEKAERELANLKRQAGGKGGGKYDNWGGGKGSGGNGKGGGKDKGKGKDKGNGKSKYGLAFEAPDGRRVCFAFNNEREGCSRPNCGYAHVCGVCFAKGAPAFKCNRDKSGQ